MVRQVSQKEYFSDCNAYLRVKMPHKGKWWEFWKESKYIYEPVTVIGRGIKYSGYVAGYYVTVAPVLVKKKDGKIIEVDQDNLIHKILSNP